MSASLVGSEMCIRDRHQEPPCVDEVFQLRDAFKLAYAGTSDRRIPQPVSYTHLTLPTICSV
eukprot:3478975-Alexandrium_andersonii.AAC.1